MRRIRFNRHTIFSTVLNVAGLTLAFAVFMTVMVQVLYDLRYDRCYPGYEKIYRLESTPPGGTGEYYPVVSRPIIEYLKTAIPQAEYIASYRYLKGRSELFNETGTDAAGVNLRFGNSDHNLLRVFPFRFISGDTTEYGIPNTAVISAKGAAKLFGNESPVGKEISFTVYSDPRPYRIVAVYEDFPDNSTIDNELLLSLGIDAMDEWSNWGQGCFMTLSTYEGAQAAADSAASFIGNQVFQIGGVNFRLTALHDAHWTKDISSDNIGKGNFTTTLVLLTVALIVIIIAAINFINFSMASVPFRIKGINTRRVLGASRGEMIWQQMTAALGLTVPAFVLSTGVMAATASSGIASYISGSLRVQDNPQLVAMTFCIAVAVAFIAGVFPARYSTSFNPAMVLKGSFSLSARGRRLRTILIGIQYVISFILILSSMFIAVQNRYMKSYDMGFDREQVLEVTITQDAAAKKETLRGMLLEHPGITGVTFSSNSIVSTDIGGQGQNYGDKFVMYDMMQVDYNFIPFFGLEITDGRDFLPSDDTRKGAAVIFNQKTMDTYPFLHSELSMPNGDDGQSYIIGVVKDFNFKPMQYKISPMALYNSGATDLPWQKGQMTVMYARILPEGVRESIDWIREKICETDPSLAEEDLDIHFLDESIGRLYQNEDRLGRLITAAAAISMMISIIGIIGLVYFETQFRRKEIAVRRVHGASFWQILLMVNRYYLAITLVCFIVTAPLATVIIRKWVSSFPYQSPVPVWIFLAALAIVTLITAVTVTLLSRRAALRNPIDSISTE